MDKVYSFSNGVLIYPYYFFSFANLVGNLENGDTFKILNEEVKNTYDLPNFTFNYSLLDAYYLNKQDVRMLIEINNQVKVIDMNMNTKVLKEVKILSPPFFKNHNKILGHYHFINANTLWALASDNTIIEVEF